MADEELVDALMANLGLSPGGAKQAPIFEVKIDTSSGEDDVSVTSIRRTLSTCSRNIVQSNGSEVEVVMEEEEVDTEDELVVGEDIIMDYDEGFTEDRDDINIYSPSSRGQREASLMEKRIEAEDRDDFVETPPTREEIEARSLDREDEIPKDIFRKGFDIFRKGFDIAIEKREQQEPELVVRSPGKEKNMLCSSDDDDLDMLSKDNYYSLTDSREDSKSEPFEAEDGQRDASLTENKIEAEDREESVETPSREEIETDSLDREGEIPKDIFRKGFDNAIEKREQPEPELVVSSPGKEENKSATDEDAEADVKPQWETRHLLGDNAYETIMGTSTHRTVQRSCSAYLTEAARASSPYCFGVAPAAFASSNHWTLHVLEGTCRAFGQAVFCNNPISGILIWLAMVVASPLAGICALVCVLTVNVAATGLGMDQTMMRKGLLAYNGVLAGSGIANYLLFDNGWTAPVVLSLISGPATLLVYSYTVGVVSPAASPLLLPFNVVTLFVLLSAMFIDATTVQLDQQQDASQTFDFISALFNGVSRMLLVTNVISGGVVVMGMALCSRVLAGTVLLGSMLGVIGSWAMLDAPMDTINDGTVAFNAALTFAALHYYVVPSIRSTLTVGVFGVLLTIVVQSAVSELFSTLSLPITVMTLPFCIVTLPIISLDTNYLCGDNALLKLIPPVYLTTPEEHLSNGFEAATKCDEFLMNEKHAIETKREQLGVTTEETPLLYV